MKLEEQVLSLKLSERLKELGVPQDSYFIWFISAYHGHLPPTIIPKENTLKLIDCQVISYSAFTTHELLKMLPQSLILKKLSFSTYLVHYLLDKDLNIEGNLPEVLAKTLIYLIENKIIKVLA